MGRRSGPPDPVGQAVHPIGLPGWPGNPAIARWQLDVALPGRGIQNFSKHGLPRIMSDISLSAPKFLPPAAVDRAPLFIAALFLLAGFFFITWQVDLRQGSLFLIGGGLGVALYHGSFGFTGGWKRMVVEKRGRGMRAQMLTIGVAAIAMLPLVAAGNIGGQPMVGAMAPVGVSVLLGAAIFGLGMQLG